jgi:hypothetical protein
VENKKIKHKKKEIAYRYTFVLEDGLEKEFSVKLDAGHLGLVTRVKGPFPEWAELEFQRCPNCPVDKDQVRYCPVAACLVGLVDFFKEHHSYEDADVIIETADRTYSKHATLLEGLSSLIGIYMVTSGCPVLEKLKPMVRFHLPFATDEETKYRVMSMYLLAQYFLAEGGEEPDWKMERLKEMYEDIRVVNSSFRNRLSMISMKDANINALVKLDCFAWSVLSALDRKSVDDIKKLFEAYLR